MSTVFGVNPLYPANRQKPMAGARLAFDISLATGLVGFWPMLEGDGTIVTDYTQKNKPGQLTSTAKWAPGAFGKAIDFSPSGSYINCGTATPVRLTTAFSISLWAYSVVGPVNGVYPRYMSKLHSVTGGFQGFEMVQAANDATGGLTHGAMYGQIALNNSLGGLSDTIAMPLGRWVHYVITFNSVGGIMNIYRDGVLRNSNFAGGTFGDNSLNLEIGASSEFGATHRFQGLLELPALWDRVVTGDEVRQLFTDPFVLFEEVSTPSRSIFASIVVTSYDNTLTVAGTSSVSLVDGGTLYRTLTINASAATTVLAGSQFAALTISGTSAISSPGGVLQTGMLGIEGTSAVSLLNGFSYSKSLSVDATSSTTVAFLYNQVLTLSINGSSAVSLDTQYTGLVPLTIAGSSAISLASIGVWYNSAGIFGTSKIFIENIFDVLLVNFVSASFSASVTKTAPGDQNPESIGTFSATAQCVFNRVVPQSLLLVQTVIVKKPTQILSQNLTFTQSAVCHKTHNETVTQTLTLTQTVEAVRGINQTLTLSDTATCVRVQNRSVIQTLAFTQELDRSLALSRSLAQTLVFNPPNLQKLPLIGSQNQTVNRQFEYYVPNLSVVLVPHKCLIILGVPSQTIVLPCPIFGDYQAYQGEISLKKSMTGLTYTYVKKVRTQKMHYAFELWTKKYLELRQFFIDHAEELMVLQNHNAETWLVYMVNNPIEFTAESRWQPRGEKYNVTLEFEGIKISG